MWQRGCFPPKTLIPPRRLHRIRGRYAALSTSVRCAHIQRRTRIEQVFFPFSKYPSIATRFQCGSLLLLSPSCTAAAEQAVELAIFGVEDCGCGGEARASAY